jgi:hypothetical protein
MTSVKPAYSVRAGVRSSADRHSHPICKSTDTVLPRPHFSGLCRQGVVHGCALVRHQNPVYKLQGCSVITFDGFVTRIDSTRGR